MTEGDKSPSVSRDALRKRKFVGHRWLDPDEVAPVVTPLIANGPRRLFHCLEGWPPNGPNGFEWDGHELRFRWGACGFGTRPTRELWAQFWTICDQVDVWNWPAWQGNRQVCDGLQYVTVLATQYSAVMAEGQVSGSPKEFGDRLISLHHAFQSLVSDRDAIARQVAEEEERYHLQRQEEDARRLADIQERNATWSSLKKPSVRCSLRGDGRLGSVLGHRKSVDQRNRPVHRPVQPTDQRSGKPPQELAEVGPGGSQHRVDRIPG